LKLELAQYREVEAFARFGSELDESTQHTLNRGVRLIELLNQSPHSPLSAFVQLVHIFAATKGYLDRLPVSDIALFKAITNSILIEELARTGGLSTLDFANPTVDESFFNYFVRKVIDIISLAAK